MKISFEIASAYDMTIVKRHIVEFMLDDSDLDSTQFIVAKHEKKIAGFGRLKNYDNVVELCSFGVIPEYQKQSIGKQLVGELLRDLEKEAYVVCIIPEFFEKCGFKIVNEYPDAIKNKLNFCAEKWPAWSKEDYIILKYSR